MALVYSLLLAVIFYTAPAAANPLSSALSFAQPHPAVVRVAVPEREGASYGSGSLVAVNESSGLVLTNWHVVRDAAGPIVVYFPDGFYSIAYLLRTDRDWDLAALAIRRPNAQPVAIANEAPRPGDILTIVGYGSGPYRAATGQCTQYLSPGDNQPFEMIELSVAARNGDSGGPIFNGRGELAGVLFGSSFGRTSGSYCGRLRWFLGLVDNDFRRISAQALLAQRSRGQQQQVASVPLASPVLGETVAPSANGAPSASSGNTLRSVNLPSATGELQSSLRQEDRHSCLSETANSPRKKTDRNVCPPDNTTPASIPSGPGAAVPTNEPIKTILAALGLVAVLYHAMRLLGRAIG